MFSYGKRNREQIVFLVSALTFTPRGARRAEGALFFWFMPLISVVVVRGWPGEWGFRG